MSSAIQAHFPAKLWLRHSARVAFPPRTIYSPRMTELMTEGRIRLGAEIQRRRKQLGLTQEELAQRMDVSRQSVTKWETGQSAPDLDRLVQLGEVLSISLDELLKGPSDNADAPQIENDCESIARDAAAGFREASPPPPFSSFSA